MEEAKNFNLVCPAPQTIGDRIVMAHGGGGKMTERLIETVFLPQFRNEALDPLHDGAVMEIGGLRLAFSTDSYVVRPLFFPGGNIGDLAVYGTVNDLAMCGARPLYLSCGFILEEGLEIAALRTIAGSMRAAAERSGVMLVTGDTKVVDRGKGDGVFVNTAGIGVVAAPRPVSPRQVQPGDAVILSGDLGRHGIAILSVREGLEFEGPIVSDTGPLWEPVEALFRAGVEVHCLRDLTRGGLSSAMNEIARSRGIEIRIDEEAVPLADPVRGACEMLGLDPLYVANEGRFAVFVPETHVELALAALRGCEATSGAVRVGGVAAGRAGMVTLRSQIGGDRVLDMLSGEQLPRIC